MKGTKMKDVTYIESIETEDFIVEVYVNNEPRSEVEIKRSMERLIKTRYGRKESRNVRFRSEN